MLELSLSTYISTDGYQSFRGLGIITECCRCHKGLRQCRVDNAGHSRDPATARECLLQEPQLRQVMAGCDCHMKLVGEDWGTGNSSKCGQDRTTLA